MGKKSARQLRIASKRYVQLIWRKFLSRRVIIILFDILTLLLCLVIHKVSDSNVVILSSCLMSIAMFIPVMFFVIKNKPNIVNKVQKNVFKVLGFIVEIVSEIPIIGFIMFLAPLVFYGITIGLIHKITGTSFFSYLVLSAICLRLIFETIWYILSKKYKSRKIQIN